MITDQLKISILNSAFTGNLSKTLPSDTDISIMMQEIEKKHNKLVEQKVIKLDKKIALPKNNDIPYVLPPTWYWNKLYFVIDVRDGTHDSPKYYKEGIPLVTSKNLNEDGTIDLDNVKFISEYDAKIINNRSKVDVGDILFAMIGSIGNPVVITDKIDFCIKNVALFKNPIKNLLDNDYLYYYLYFSQQKMKKESSGGVQQFVSLHYLRNFYIPLPPIEEQHRIVDKIEEIFTKLDEIKPIEDQLRKIKSVFPIIMEKSILESAIMGKLSRQNLDEKITLVIDKIHKITPPFDIPKNWSWYSHNDLFEIVGGSQPPKSKFSSQKKEGYIRLYQIRDYGPSPQPIYVKKDDVTKFSNKGDIILARYGGSLGKVFWAESGAYNVALAKVIIKYPQIINKKYLYYYYLADLYQSKVKNGNRSAQAGFSKDDLNDLPFPLPPLEEQKRIVDKLEQLLPICDDIEKIVGELNGH